MKLLKYINLLIFSSLLLLSCGDDSTDTAAIRYTESQSGLVDFKLYYGSENGGVEYPKIIDSLKRKPEVFFALASFESYTSTVISFVGEKISVEQSGVREIFPCKFEDGSLYVEKNGDYRYYGDGDQFTLDIRQHYVGYKTGDGSFTILPTLPMKEIDKDYAASLSSFGTVADMLNAEDTLIWVTRKAAFR